MNNPDVDVKRPVVANIAADLLKDELRPFNVEDTDEVRYQRAAHDLWRELSMRGDGTLPFHFEPETEVFVFDGVAYSLELFQGFGTMGLKDGTCIQIVKRENGTVTLRNLPDMETAVGNAYKEGFNDASAAAAELDPS
jgi:hypothetical protein